MKFWNEYIYSYQPSIVAELKSRRDDLELKSKVESLWGDLYPDFLSNEQFPLAFFSRPTITPNMETRFFLDILPDFNLKPLFMEFPDKFVSLNESKYYAAKIHTFTRTAKGHQIVNKQSIINFQEWEGKPLAKVTTKDGQLLQDYHHSLFKQEFPQFSNNIIDITDWFDAVRHGYDDFYYLGYLALGVYHGVLFENFLLDDEKEVEFFFDRVVPSFKEIEKIFGVKPLISPVLPLTMAKLDEWYFYPTTTTRQSM